MKAFYFFVILVLSQPIFGETFGPGDAVEVQWKGVWYSASVVKATSSQWLITYEGFGNTYDEWVGPERIRGVSMPSRASELSLGDPVEILWQGAWYPGRILNKKEKSYFVSYDGWESKWNEWVGLGRIKPLKKSSNNSPLDIKDLESPGF